MHFSVHSLIVAGAALYRYLMLFSYLPEGCYRLIAKLLRFNEATSVRHRLCSNLDESLKDFVDVALIKMRMS